MELVKTRDRAESYIIHVQQMSFCNSNSVWMLLSVWPPFSHNIHDKPALSCSLVATCIAVHCFTWVTLLDWFTFLKELFWLTECRLITVGYWPSLGSYSCSKFQRFSRAGQRGREWATLGVHPLSWLLSNNRLEEVCSTLTKGTFFSRLLLSNQDKGCIPSVAHSLPLGPALLNLSIMIFHRLTVISFNGWFVRKKAWTVDNCHNLTCSLWANCSQSWPMAYL